MRVEVEATDVGPGQLTELREAVDQVSGRAVVARCRSRPGRIARHAQASRSHGRLPPQVVRRQHDLLQTKVPASVKGRLQNFHNCPLNVFA